jgi:Peptidase family M20/M25/M40
MFVASRATNITKARKVLNPRLNVLSSSTCNFGPVSALQTRGIHTGTNAYDKGSTNTATSKSRRNAVVEGFFADSHAYSQHLHQEIQNQARDLSDFLTSTRRNLHKRPELMYREKETSAMIQTVLKDLDIPFSTGWAVNTNPHVIPGPGGYGVVADIGTGKDPCVLLRADIDALPIHEQTESVEEFKSQNPDRMHACGHDGHTTMLLGAASILKGMEESINGTVRLMFQPAEEGGAGGKRMVEEGLLNLQPQPQYAFGMHVWPT